MSGVGLVQPHDDDILAPVPHGRSRRPWVIGVVAVVAVLGAGFAAIAVLADDDVAEVPSSWDPRIAELADFVEDERGLEFDHPVPVDFLSDEEFNKEVVTDEAELDDDEREQLEQTEALLRALGLIGADVDFLAETQELSGEGILGLYIPEEERVKVRGTEMTPQLRVTLVHELTHVLQDQIFDIDSEMLEEDTGEASGTRAMLEGDAELVARAYAYDELDADEFDELTEFQSEGSEDAYGDAPPVLVAVLSAPYQLGYSFLDVVMAAGGDDARDDALRDPPMSEEQLLDPWAYLDDDDPIEVDTPELATEETALDPDASPHFGALSWYAVLAQRIDARDALTAVDGWGGDSYVAFERAGRVCVRVRFAGDDTQATDTMAGALDRWVAAGPSGMSKVTRHDSYTELESCDQGVATVSPPESDVSILVLPELRSELGAALIVQGADVDVAGCAANDLVIRFPLETYADPSDTPFTGSSARQLLSEAISNCDD